MTVFGAGDDDGGRVTHDDTGFGRRHNTLTITQSEDVRSGKGSLETVSLKRDGLSGRGI